MVTIQLERREKPNLVLQSKGLIRIQVGVFLFGEEVKTNKKSGIILGF